MAGEIAKGKSSAMVGEIEKIIMSNENRGRGMKEGWKKAKLSELCSIERGGSPRPIKNYITEEPDGINWIKIGDTDKDGKYIYSTAERIKTSGLKKSRWVDVNDFLLSNSMSFGRPYILKTNGCIHDGWLVLRNYQTNLIIDFFYYLLISPRVQEQFRSKAQGSTVSNLNTQRVANVLVSYPPLSEQQSIVAHLDASFAEIDALKAKAAEEVANAKAMFDAALREEMTPKEGWEEMKMSDICSIKSKLVNPQEEKYQNLLHVGGANIVSKSGELINLLTAKQEKLESGKFYFENDVVLYNKIRPYLKKVARPSFMGLCSADMYPLTPATQMSKDYLFYILISEDFTSYAISGSARAGMPKVNRDHLFAYQCKVPPISTQQRIVAKLDTLRSHLTVLEQKYNHIAANCDALKQAILRETFE